MAEFVCRLGTPTGEVITRTIEAPEERDVRLKLEREGFRIFSVAAPGAIGIKSVLGSQKRSGKIKTEAFLLFNQQMSALLRPRLVLEDVEDKIRAGHALSQAFAAQGDTFPRIYIASILAGERSGSLDEVLLRYVSYQKTIGEVRRKMKKSLSYPIVLVCASFILVMVLSTYVIPNFMQLYGNVGAQTLPTITVVVVGTAEFIRGNVYWLLPVIVLTVIVLLLWRRTPSG